jgi:hypothetical protein
MQTIDLVAEQEAEDVVALTRDETGIANTIFVSPRGYARHAARLKIAIDPPDTFDSTATTASMRLHDYEVSGANIPAPLTKQVIAFIDLNRGVLLEYWNNKIATAELLRRIRPV